MSDKARLAFLLKVRHNPGKYPYLDKSVVVRAELVTLSDEDGKPRNISGNRWDGTAGMAGITVKSEVRAGETYEYAHLAFESYGSDLNLYEVVDAGKVAARIGKSLTADSLAFGEADSVGTLTERVARALKVREFVVQTNESDMYTEGVFASLTAGQAVVWLNSKVAEFRIKSEAVPA